MNPLAPIEHCASQSRQRQLARVHCLCLGHCNAWAGQGCSNHAVLQLADTCHRALSNHTRLYLSAARCLAYLRQVRIILGSPLNFCSDAYRILPGLSLPRVLLVCSFRSTETVSCLQACLSSFADSVQTGRVLSLLGLYWWPGKHSSLRADADGGPKWRARLAMDICMTVPLQTHRVGADFGLDH
jgi:hypothetical protein